MMIHPEHLHFPTYSASGSWFLWRAGRKCSGEEEEKPPPSRPAPPLLSLRRSRKQSQPDRTSQCTYVHVSDTVSCCCCCCCGDVVHSVLLSLLCATGKAPNGHMCEQHCRVCTADVPHVRTEGGFDHYRPWRRRRCCIRSELGRQK